MRRVIAALLFGLAGSVATGMAWAEPDCIKLGEICAEAGGTRVINGVLVAKDCWRYTSTYECRSPSTTSNCQPLRDRACVQIGSICISTAPDGSCALYDQHYRCPLTPERVEERSVCQTALCQPDGTGCFDTSYPADRDLGRAAAAVEAQREAGVYGVNAGAIDLFKGYSEQCSVKVLGGAEVKSCCTGAGGGQNYTNHAVLGVTAKAAYAVASEEVRAGSKFVYDALFTAQDAALVQQGTAAAVGGLSDSVATGMSAQAGTSFGAYGFEFSYSAAGGFEFLAFDPATFALSVAIMIVTEWLACDQAEQVMQMKRGQNLCAFIGSQCTSKVLGVCVEKKETHCCFNSVLAKLINRQGRAQLGMPLDACDGFTQADFERLDFARIDFSEFIATIAPKDMNVGTTTGDVTNTVNQKIRDYYGGP